MVQNSFEINFFARYIRGLPCTNKQMALYCLSLFLSPRVHL